MHEKRCAGWYGYGLISRSNGNGSKEFGVVSGNALVKRCRMHIYYSGRVQGVGFRYTTKNVATGYEVTGCVRNLKDGRVELIAEGQRQELEEFRGAIRDSGLGSFISDENVAWEDAQGEFRGFEITS
jgi:acylphosphatase